MSPTADQPHPLPPPPANNDIPRPSGPDVPPWLPHGQSWDSVPPSIRAAAAQFLPQAYRELVLNAPNSLERTAGVTIVQLLWLELLQQSPLAEAAANEPADSDQVQELLKRLNTLLITKNKSLQALARLKVVNRLLARSANSSPWRLVPPGTFPPIVDRPDPPNVFKPSDTP